MSDRDPMPTTPPCPACETAYEVRRHDAPHQGRFLCLACMLLFDGISAEWARPARERGSLDGIDEARAALHAAQERSK